MKLTPSGRLLLLWAIAGVPLLGLAGVAPGSRGAALSGVGLVVLAAAIDAARSRRSLSSVEISVTPVTRLVRGKTGALEVRADSASRPRLWLALAPSELVEPQPETLEWVWPRAAAANTANAADATDATDATAPRMWAAWPMRARERGKEVLERVYAEVDSPWRLWRLRRAFPVNAEFRVYPDLGLDARRSTLNLLTRGLPGRHLVRQLGKGREFDRLREYVSGDALDEIHWKATARHGRPISKVYQVERTQEVYIAIDRSRLSARRIQGKPTGTLTSAAGADTEATPAESEPVLEAFLRAALVLGLATRRFSDHFGLLTFSDRVDRFVRAGSGGAHWNACREALVEGHARPVAPDFAELASFVRNRLRRRALIVVLTDLEDPVHAEAFATAARLLIQPHLLLVFGMRRPGIDRLFSARATSEDEVYAGLAGHRRWQRLEETRRGLGRLGVEFELSERAELAADVVSRYALVKSRQRL